jgi:hypothetical protein
MPIARFAAIGIALGLGLVAGSVAQIVDPPDETPQRRIAGIFDRDTNRTVFDVNDFHVESYRRIRWAPRTTARRCTSCT